MEEEGDGGWQQEVNVMSDVHVGCPPGATSCLSVFTITPPTPAGGDDVDKKAWNPENNHEQRELKQDIAEEIDGRASEAAAVTYDANGDLVLRRRPKRQRRTHQSDLSGGEITIHHQLATRLPGVGLQIWRGALLLADYLLDTMSSSKRFHGVIALELGAGTGLTGMVMARAAKQVFITGQFWCADRDTIILDNCTRNVLANTSSYPGGDGSVQVRKLDWEQPWPPVSACNVEDTSEGEKMREESAYAWNGKDLEEAASASVLLAADVVYSPDLTKAFFGVLDQLMTFGVPKILFLALEKRYNFSVDELDIVAYGYRHFRYFFQAEDSDDSTGHKDCNKVAAQDHSSPKDNRLKFKGRQIPVDQLPQHVVEYERGKDLELWEIWRC